MPALDHALQSRKKMNRKSRLPYGRAGGEVAPLATKTNRCSSQWLAEGSDDRNRSPSVGACMSSAFHLSSTGLEIGLSGCQLKRPYSVNRFAHEQIVHLHRESGPVAGLRRVVCVFTISCQKRKILA